MKITYVLKVDKEGLIQMEFHDTNLEWLTERMQLMMERGYKVSLTEHRDT